MENASIGKRTKVNLSFGVLLVCLLLMFLRGKKGTLLIYPDSSPSYTSLLFPAPNTISDIQNVFTNAC